MESKRKVISEAEILAVDCPTCARRSGKTCVAMSSRTPLAFEINATECSFHAARIMKAQDVRLTHVGFTKPLDPTTKSLILYYAYIMLCDSVSARSLEVLGKEQTSEEIQMFFAQQAVMELRKDGLFKDAKAN